jgi:hypothetical protein
MSESTTLKKASETTSKAKATTKTIRKTVKKTEETAKELTYKGLPLARLGHTIYYGDPNAKYVIKLSILECVPKDELELATKVSVELLSSFNHNICKKKSEKTSLYRALDLGQIWLKKILSSAE